MRQKPIEGIDYYIEGQRTIFTEEYHLKRGYCCNCHCKHCPWKSKKINGNQIIKIINSENQEKICEFNPLDVVDCNHDNSGD